MIKKLHDPQEEVITVNIDGVPVIADANEGIAAVALRQTPLLSCTTPVSEMRRGHYLMMGAFLECLATVDGVSIF